MRKNNIKYISIFIALICLIFSSCSDLFNDFSNTTLSVNVDNACSRNVLPESDISVFTDFKLEGTLDEQSQVLGTWNDYEALSNASITINPGKWNFTLSAKKDGITFTCDKSDIEIVKGENNSVSFSLSATSDGKAKIKLTYPMGAGVKYVSWSILSNDGETKVMEDLCLLATESTSQSLTQGAFNLVKELSAGKYIFNCYFYSYEDSNPLSTKLIGSYTDLMIVESGLETKLEHNITYFDVTGILSLKSTEEGMEVEFTIPKGTRQHAEVYRGEVGPDGSLQNVTGVLRRYYHSQVTKNDYCKGLDLWNISKDKTYGYYVVYDWDNSTKTPVVYVNSNYNGFEAPTFATAPQFMIKNDEYGNPDKLVYIPPEIDWKGHDLGWGISFDFGIRNVITSEEEYWWVSSEGGEYTLKDGWYRIFQFEFSINPPWEEDGTAHAYHSFFFDPDDFDIPELKKGDVAFPDLTANATENGVQLTVTSIPANAVDVFILSGKLNQGFSDLYHFSPNGSNKIPSELTVCDNTVTYGEKYQYRLDIWVSNNCIQPEIKTVEAIGGLGELNLSATPSAEGIELEYTIPQDLKLSEIQFTRRKSYPYNATEKFAENAVITYRSNENPVIDYFVKAGETYIYNINLRINAQTSYNSVYYPHSSSKTVVANAGHGEAQLSNYPVASNDVQNKQLIFSVEPELNISDLETLSQVYSISKKLEIIYQLGNYGYGRYYDFNTAKTYNYNHLYEHGSYYAKNDYYVMLDLINSSSSIYYRIYHIGTYDQIAGIPNVTIE